MHEEDMLNQKLLDGISKVWTDIGIKSCPIFKKLYPILATAVLLLLKLSQTAKGYSILLEDLSN